MGKQIKVPEKIYNRLEKRAEEKGFDTCEAYVVDILSQVRDKLEKKEIKKVNFNFQNKRETRGFIESLKNSKEYSG